MHDEDDEVKSCGAPQSLSKLVPAFRLQQTSP
jgi:hypothetical protein